jgi:hypothetical protein
MEELAAEMVFLERSPSTKLRIGISLDSVILTGQVPASTRIKSAVARSHRARCGSRPVESLRRVALTFDHVAISRRHAPNCLPSTARRKQGDSHARRSNLPGPMNSKAKTQGDRLSVRQQRTAWTGTKPRYKITLGKDGERRKESDAVLRAGRRSQMVLHRLVAAAIVIGQVK